LAPATPGKSSVAQVFPPAASAPSAPLGSFVHMFGEAEITARHSARTRWPLFERIIRLLFNRFHIRRSPS